MYKKVTILFIIIACSFTFVYGQSINPPHWQGDPTQQPVVQPKILKVYPNPATTYINFQIQSNNDNSYDIIVYNFLGKKIDELKNISGTKQLNLSNYFSGIYIYQVRDQSGNLVESGKFNVISQ